MRYLDKPNQERGKKQKNSKNGERKSKYNKNCMKNKDLNISVKGQGLSELFS